MTQLDTDVFVIDCAEYEYVDIDADLWLGDTHQTVFNSEIDGRDVLRASFQRGVVRLQATSYVGVIPLNDRVVVRVRPRVPLASLTRMVLDTGHSVLPLSALREYSTRGTANDWTMDLYAKALVARVDELLDLGLLRSYRQREAEGHHPHGYVKMGGSIQRFAARGVPNKAAFSWFERTTDVPPNRCIKAAIDLLLSHFASRRTQPRKEDRALVTRLAGQVQAFDEVQDDPEQDFLNDPQVLGLTSLPDPRSYYRPALDLSLSILGGRGIALELGGDDLRMSSLLIDTNTLFERFVRVSLSRHARQSSWAADVLDGNTVGAVPLYEVPPALPRPFGTPLRAVAAIDPGRAQPDIVLRTPDGVVLLVAEVKNTVHGRTANGADRLPSRDEVEQAVTYALRYRQNFCLLIHPWVGSTKGLVYVGRINTIDVFDYRLDLSTEEGLDAALADMARTVATLSGLGGA